MFFKKKVKNEFGLNLDEKRLNTVVEYTLLEPTVTKKQLEKFLCVAYKNKYFSVCLNPVNINFAKKYIDFKFKSALKICTVIGFPLGESTTETKIFEMKNALKNGADEFDVVAPIGRIKDQDWAYIKQEFTKLRHASKRKIVKIIIDTPLLNRPEIEKVCNFAVKCKIDYVMTCSGYSGGGAEPSDIEIIRGVIKQKCGIKASGGIETKAQALLLLRAGATRIGTSREI